MSTREIISLQFGNYSNFVGAHFWNLQELSFDYTGAVKTEVNHDILYREGKTASGDVTYTPRLLLADLKGSLNTLPEQGGLPNEASQDLLPWDNMEEIVEPAQQKNEYLQDIDMGGSSTVKTKDYNFDNAQSWTDFLYPRLHSRSVNIVKDYQHKNDNVCTYLLFTRKTKVVPGHGRHILLDLYLIPKYLLKIL